LTWGTILQKALCLSSSATSPLWDLRGPQGGSIRQQGRNGQEYLPLSIYPCWS
jgi:hypothetical protein